MYSIKYLIPVYFWAVSTSLILFNPLLPCYLDISCGLGEFKCGDSECIQSNWLCDGSPDCRNGEDEMNCTVVECSDDSFTCKDGSCISLRWRCDGQQDCQDASDEQVIYDPYSIQFVVKITSQPISMSIYASMDQRLPQQQLPPYLWIWFVFNLKSLVFETEYDVVLAWHDLLPMW